ncbi:hypothetical protein PLUTE_a3996 [Pseudoalteromonas luteoviolacea DSM 6061]|nr:hypothetical protein [Pseudoalteromonas luteoviolacea DSM 6061]
MASFICFKLYKSYSTTENRAFSRCLFSIHLKHCGLFLKFVKWSCCELYFSRSTDFCSLVRLALLNFTTTITNRPPKAKIVDKPNVT